MKVQSAHLQRVCELANRFAIIIHEESFSVAEAAWNHAVQYTKKQEDAKLEAKNKTKDKLPIGTNN